MTTSTLANQFKGEILELYEELNNTDIEMKTTGVKRVIAYMTVGKDVSMLFQNVIKCLEFPNMELKKLVYLYIINYSRSKPDDAIMVINSFRKDIQFGTPLIKALAVRTMGCLRVKQLNEYLVEPLKKTLRDVDPYVRKTAALCVPKVYEVSQELVDREEIINIMQDMLESETNAFVLANVIRSLHELSIMKKECLMKINQKILRKMLISVNEAVEWGQIFILECLENYVPCNRKEIILIIDRITARLQHINPTVVLTAVNVIVKYLDYHNIQKDITFFEKIQNKLSAPLATLVSWQQPEIQYTILKNVRFILVKYPNLLKNFQKVFFVKFNEPHYIKQEKLDILISLCDKKNYDSILKELKEYVNEIDPNFVKKCIKCIVNIGLIYESSLQNCAHILMSLFKKAKKSAPEIRDEVLNGMQLLYRKDPSLTTHEDSLTELSSVFDQLDPSDSSGLVAAVWMLGEFCIQIDSSCERLQKYINKFLDYDRNLQLQILTAAVKIFLVVPDDAAEMIEGILTLVTEKCDNADIRDRAYIYWRMLSIDPELTKQLVLAQTKPPAIQQQEETQIQTLISTQTQSNRREYNQTQNQSLNTLMNNIGKVSTVFHLMPEQMFAKEKVFEYAIHPEAVTDVEAEGGTDGQSPLEDDSNEGNINTNAIKKEQKTEQQKDQTKGMKEKVDSNSMNIDLLDMDNNIGNINDAIANETDLNKKTDNNLIDLFDDTAINKQVFSVVGEIQPNSQHNSNSSILSLFITNLSTSSKIDRFKITRVGESALNLQIENMSHDVKVEPPIAYQETRCFSFQIACLKNKDNYSHVKDTSDFVIPIDVQAAQFTCSTQISYKLTDFMCPKQQGQLSSEMFNMLWSQIPSYLLLFESIQMQNKVEQKDIIYRLEKNHIYMVDQNSNQQMSFSCKTNDDFVFLMKMQFENKKVDIQMTSLANQQLVQIFKNNIKQILMQETKLDSQFQKVDNKQSDFNLL